MERLYIFSFRSLTIEECYAGFREDAMDGDAFMVASSSLAPGSMRPSYNSYYDTLPW